MRKVTKAYQLDPVTDPVTEPIKAFRYENVWYPITEEELKNKEIYIYGQGWKRLSPSMINSIQEVKPLTNNWTAQDIKDRKDTFSLEVAMGLLQGWGRVSLFQDQSFVLNAAKHEIYNMSLYGSVYDDLTDRLHILSQRFISSLFKKGYRLEGGWLRYKDELIGKTGLYESIKLYLTQYIEHALKGIYPVSPMFDVIGFEDMLIKLIVVQEKHRYILDKYVSVKDRVKFLSTDKIADDIENIFTWFKGLRDLPKYMGQGFDDLIAEKLTKEF